ncbi:MAG: hypothetical protein HY247_06730 [archaeon]|nr:MAG: hypothetical protein HY247_06730 [archaeon]
MEQPRIDVEAASFRLTIITSFLLGATMITLSLNVPIIKLSLLSGTAGIVEGALAVSIALMLFATLIMLFMSYVILATIPLALFTVEEKLQRIARVRVLVGLASIFIMTSFGSTFIVALGVSSPWSWLFGGIGYGSGVVWALLRAYYLTKYVNPKRPQ